MKKSISVLCMLFSLSVFADDSLITKLDTIRVLCSAEINDLREVQEEVSENPVNETLRAKLLVRESQVFSCKEESKKLLSQNKNKNCKEKVSILLSENRICSEEAQNLEAAYILFERAPSINTSIDFEVAKRTFYECIETADGICL